MTRSNSLVRSLESVVLKGLSAAIGRASRGRPKPPEPPFTGSAGGSRILVCKWCCMGDAILTLYALRALKRAHPGLTIDMLVSSRIAEVYRRSPDVGAVHVLPVTGRRLILELLNPGLWIRLAALLRTLRAGTYGQFIDLELYRGTGPVLKRLLGIPYSRGFQVDGAPPKHHDFEVPRPRRMPEWRCFYHVLGMASPENPPEPLYGHLRSTPTLDSEHGVRPGPHPSRIGIVPGSSFNWPQKKWPWEHFAETISLLAPAGHEFVLFGTPMEREENRKIVHGAGIEIQDTTGKLDYGALLKAIASCDLVVGNDTGTLHLAAACGIPTVTLFGPTDPDKWNPLTSTPVFLEEVACRPCYYLGSMPPCTHFSCLRKLKPAMVAERIRQALGKDPEIPEAAPD